MLVEILASLGKRGFELGEGLRRHILSSYRLLLATNHTEISIAEAATKGALNCIAGEIKSGRTDLIQIVLWLDTNAYLPVRATNEEGETDGSAQGLPRSRNYLNRQVRQYPTAADPNAAGRRPTGNLPHRPPIGAGLPRKRLTIAHQIKAGL